MARSPDEILEELVKTVRTTDRRVGEMFDRLRELELSEPEKRPEPRPPQPMMWPELMDHLKRKRTALTAAVYGEASPVWEGDRLLLIYPEEQSFHVGMARENVHQEKLLDALEEVYGIRPAEIRVFAQGGPFDSTSE